MKSTEKEQVLEPKIHPSVFIAKGACIFGDVEISEGSSVWFNAVIRGDEGKIRIGKNTNIQDNVVIHSDDGAEAIIGNNVTIGHGSVVRGCRIGDNVMAGMNATIMSDAVIGDNCVIGANALVPYKFFIDNNSLALGVPAEIIRQTSSREHHFIDKAVTIYSQLIKKYQNRQILGFRKH